MAEQGKVAELSFGTSWIPSAHFGWAALASFHLLSPGCFSAGFPWGYCFRIFSTERGEVISKTKINKQETLLKKNHEYF